MFTSLFLTASLAGGQPPEAVYYPGGVIPSTKPTVPAPTPPVYRLGFPTPLTTLPDLAATDNPSTPMPAPKAATPADASGSPNGNGNGNGEQAEPEEEEKAPPKYLLERTLAQTRLGQILNNRGITIYGWTAGSYNVATPSGSTLPVTMADRANELLMNQNWLHMEKAVDTSKDEFQWGWNVDWILPGSDYRFTLPRGIWNGQLTSNNGGPQLYGIDPYQFYLQSWMPGVGPKGTKLIVGRFQTHIGYELVQQVDTPFVSRSYLFQYNPFTHTGAWATTQLNDDWSVGNGIATGIDTFIDPTNRFTYLGQLRWAPPEGDTTAAFNIVLTDPNYQANENFTLFNVYNFLLTHKLSDKLTYVLDSMYSHTGNTPVGFADWYGAANYFIYNVNDKSAATVRAEVFDDNTGFWTGFEGLYTEITAGWAWKPFPGLMIRPSARFDYNGYSRPFEGDHHLWTGIIEAIVRW